MEKLSMFLNDNKNLSKIKHHCVKKQDTSSFYKAIMQFEYNKLILLHKRHPPEIVDINCLLFSQPAFCTNRYIIGTYVIRHFGSRKT